MTYRAMTSLGASTIYTHCLKWGGEGHTGKLIYNKVPFEPASYIPGNVDPYRVCFQSFAASAPPAIPYSGSTEEKCLPGIKTAQGKVLCFRGIEPGTSPAYQVYWGGEYDGQPVYSMSPLDPKVFVVDAADPLRVRIRTKDLKAPPKISPPSPKASKIPLYQCYDGLIDTNGNRVCFQAYPPSAGKPPAVQTIYTAAKMSTAMSVPTVATTYSPPKTPIYVAPPPPKYTDYNPVILTEATPTAVPSTSSGRTTTVYTVPTAPIFATPPIQVGPPPSSSSAETPTSITPAPSPEQQWMADNFMDPAEVSANQGSNKALLVGGLLVLAAIGGVVVWKGMKK